MTNARDRIDAERCATQHGYPGAVSRSVHPDGTHLRRITGGASDRAPDWSPGGARLVFSRAPAGSGNSDLWTVKPDGTGLQRVTKTSLTSGREIGPAWSPNGKRIVFYDQARGALSTIAPDGTGRAKVRDMQQGAGAPDWQAL